MVRAGNTRFRLGAVISRRCESQAGLVHNEYTLINLRLT